MSTSQRYQTFHEVANATDWDELAEQKLALIGAMIVFRDKLRNPTRDIMEEHLTGLLNLVDAFQTAAENEGYPVVWEAEADKDELDP